MRLMPDMADLIEAKAKGQVYTLGEAAKKVTSLRGSYS
jgi:hypothetical protein